MNIYLTSTFGLFKKHIFLFLKAGYSYFSCFPCILASRFITLEGQTYLLCFPVMSSITSVS